MRSWITFTKSPLTRINPPTCNMQPAIPAADKPTPTRTRKLSRKQWTLVLRAIISCLRWLPMLCRQVLAGSNARLFSLIPCVQNESLQCCSSSSWLLDYLINGTGASVSHQSNVTLIDSLHAQRSCMATHRIGHISCGPSATKTLEAGLDSLPAGNHTSTSAANEATHDECERVCGGSLQKGGNNHHQDPNNARSAT